MFAQAQKLSVIILAYEMKKYAHKIEEKLRPRLAKSSARVKMRFPSRILCKILPIIQGPPKPRSLSRAYPTSRQDPLWRGGLPMQYRKCTIRDLSKISIQAEPRWPNYRWPISSLLERCPFEHGACIVLGFSIARLLLSLWMSPEISECQGRVSMCLFGWGIYSWLTKKLSPKHRLKAMMVILNFVFWSDAKFPLLW